MITVEEALSVHDFLANHYDSSDDPISPRGVKDIGLLESAINRPFASAGQKDAYPTIMDKAAALFHGVISNHCFYNGNKRTALLLTMCFLDSNGYWVDKCGDEELFEFTKKVAAHEVTANRVDEIKKIKEFFKKNSRRSNNVDKPLSYLELSRLLHDAGFSLCDRGDYINVESNKTGKLMTKILKKGCSGVESYDPPYIRKLRKKLGLTSTNGWDSVRFYQNCRGLTDNIGNLLRLRGAVMDWLAKI